MYICDKSKPKEQLKPPISLKTRFFYPCWSNHSMMLPPNGDLSFASCKMNSVPGGYQ